MTNITRILISSVMVISIAVNASAESISTALPQGHRINSGAGTFSATGSILKIEQATPVLDTNWSSFDIGSQSSVSIVQPTSNSTFIARVQSGQVSEVNGAISANGRVVLTNPNGIIFGSASRVDVGGLVAAAGQLRSYDPAEERFSFDQLNGTITQDGVIAGDFVALVGGSIKQKGTIKTRAGDAALAAGDSVLMNLGPNGVLSVEVSAEEALGTIEQSGEIVAGGAAVIKADAAQKLLFEAVNGKSETKLVMRNGKLELVEISGIIAAKSIGIDAGDQGSVEVNSHLTATDGDKGGQIDVLGGSVVVSSAATLDVSGQSGGGIINVGGSWQNSDPTVRQSIVTYVEAGASLIADAKRQGDGGSIVVWSDVNNELSETSANGHFSAASLVGPGNGGRIETSGFSLNTERATGTAAAANGQPGMWLFDPYNITVSSTSTTNWDAGTGSTGSPSNISVETIKGLLESGTSVIIHTTGDGNGSEKGNIAWNADLLANLQNEVSLKLQAHGDISINNKIEATGDAALNVTLNTNLGGAADSNLVVNDYILTNGGDILIGGGSAGDASGFVTGNGVAVSINESIRSYGGDIVIRGKSTSASLAGAAGVLVSSKQIFSDAGQLSLYGEFESTHLEARGVRLDINDNIAGSVDSWLPAGSDSFSVEAARAVLHSSKATDNAIYISAINTGTSTNNAQIGLDVNWIGNMKSGAGNAANTAPFFANGGGNVVLTTGNSIGRIRVPAGVYINGNHGGEYHLITKSGFAATQYTTSGNTITLSSIGLTSVGGSWAPSLGTTGNPKTIIQTDTTDSLNFDFNSSGDLSIYGLTNSDVLNNNYSISVTKATSANTANVRLSSPLTNLRLTGGDVQLRNIEAKNVQVVANNIIVGHFDRSYNVLCGTNSGNIVACNSGFGSATNMVEKAYLRASISIRDDAENSDHYDAKLHVKELVLDSPVIDLRHGGWFNGTVDDSQAYGFTYHNIGKVAVKNADIAYISNANSIEIGSITTTAFDGSISDTLSTTVSGINASGASTRVIVETATGDLTVSANITSQGGGDGSNKHASQAASESLTEYFKFFTSVNGYKKVLTSNFMDWQNEANITRFGDYFDFPLILNAGFADTGHTNGSIVISGSPEITVEAGKGTVIYWRC